MRRYAILLTACVCLSACDSSEGSSVDLSSATDPTVDHAEKYADTAPTFDSELNAVSLEHPGFKGVVGSDDGTEVLVLVDQVTAGRSTTENVSLTEAISERLGVEPSRLRVEAASAVAARSGPAASTAVRPDFHVLYDVKTALRRFMFETDLVNSLDLDETTGRVVVGAASSAAIDQLRTSMTTNELENVDFVVTERATPFPLVSDETSSAAGIVMVNRSLRNDQFIPLIGGTEIDFQNSAGSLVRCTQGPVVRYNNGAYGFLTNSHCTFDREQISNIDYYQPSIAGGGNLIGRETAEPAYRSGFFITDGFYADVRSFAAPTGQPFQER
jgi:hypothetical protein